MFDAGINPTSQLKLPKGVFKAASNRSVLSELRFYYKLKCLKIDGCFKRGNILKPIAGKLHVSQSTVSRAICKLIKAQFAFYDNDRNLCLAKYDTVWQALGLNTEAISLFKVHPKTWEDDYIYNELKKNFVAQRKAIQRKRRDAGSNTKINSDVSLSYAGAAKLFGVSSHKAFRMIKVLETTGVITLIRRRKFYGKGDLSQFIKTHEHGYQKKGAIFKVLPNKIVFNV